MSVWSEKNPEGARIEQKKKKRGGEGRGESVTR